MTTQNLRNPRIDGVRWKVALYIGLMIAESLCVGFALVFGTPLVEPMLLGDAPIGGIDWFVLFRANLTSCAAITAVAIATGLVLEMSRRWLKRRWVEDLGVSIYR